MGECHVHKEINARTVNERRAQYADAEVLVHPECGCAGQLIYEIGMGDTDAAGVHIASTEGMVKHAESSRASRFIVATEVGILHRMRQIAPEKEFLPADPEATCAFMKTITLESVHDALVHDRYRVTVPEQIRARARAAIDRMVQIG